jgi:predicted phage terminase large subunit-like protein
LIEQATLEQVESVLLSRCFRDYIRGAWPIHEPSTPFQSNWHIDAISEHLEAVTAGQIRDLAINIPPRHGKSNEVSVFWPTWCWTHSAFLKWLYTSYALQLSLRDSVYCRRLIESPWYRARWGHRFKLTSDQNQKGRFDNDQHGYRLATSVGGAATGEGGDIIVCDDPHNVEEAESEVVRESTIEWWDQTMSTRLNDPKTGRRVVVMQRVHERDLTGHILEQGGWDHLCLPAEYEGRRRATSIGWVDPRQTAGELLWPDRFGHTEIAKLKKILGSYAAAGQLQQRPSPAEGGLIKKSWWQYYTEVPKGLDKLLFCWDCTFKDADTSDYVVGQAWGLSGAHCYLLDQTRGQWDITETIRQIRALRAKWVAVSGLTRDPSAIPRVLVEDKANGSAIISVLRHEVPGIIAWPPKGRRMDSKEARVQAVAPLIEAGQVWLPKGQGFSEQLVDEAAGFPNGAHDDAIDCCAHALNALQPGAWNPMAKAVPPPKDLRELRARQWAEALVIEKPAANVPPRYSQLNRR